MMVDCTMTSPFTKSASGGILKSAGIKSESNLDSDPKFVTADVSQFSAEHQLPHLSSRYPLDRRGAQEENTSLNVNYRNQRRLPQEPVAVTRSASCEKLSLHGLQCLSQENNNYLDSRQTLRDSVVAVDENEQEQMQQSPASLIRHLQEIQLQSSSQTPPASPAASDTIADMDQCFPSGRLAVHKSSSGKGHNGIVRMLSFQQNRNRKVSTTSVRSSSHPQEILQSFGRTIQKTTSHLKRTKCLHIFYLLCLPAYTVIGALIFQALDGHHDDQQVTDYNARCIAERESSLIALQEKCNGKLYESCLIEVESVALAIDRCFRNWHAVNRTIDHPLSDFTNALVFAFSVYTTIGYGNMAADTTQCRIATLIYGVLGIPLFFAFVKEEGNFCRAVFVRLCSAFRHLRRRLCCWGRCWMLKNKAAMDGAGIGFAVGQTGNNLEMPAVSHKSSGLHRFARKSSSMSVASRAMFVGLQRRVFVAGVLVFVIYLLAISLVFSFMTGWDFFTAFYFMFNSVALIGFGDVFPKEPRVLLINVVAIIIGVVLFSMCYFILQEEIREKAVEATKKARLSLHTLMYSVNTLSRRNSPYLAENNVFGSFERMKRRRQSAPEVVGLRATPPKGSTSKKKLMQVRVVVNSASTNGSSGGASDL